MNIRKLHKADILEDVDPYVCNLCVTFQGFLNSYVINHVKKYGCDRLDKLKPPPFAFKRAAEKMVNRPARICNFIYVRDRYQLWYNTIFEDLLRYLTKRIQELKPKRVIFFGHSSGAYAALLFGHFLKVDLVIAACPQTIIFNHDNGVFKNHYGITGKFLNETNNFRMNLFKKFCDKRFIDLKCILPFESKRIKIYYSNKIKEDIQHVHNILGQDTIETIAYKLPHTIFKTPRKKEILESIVNDILYTVQK